MSPEILDEKILEKLGELKSGYVLQCVRDHKRPEPLDADTVPGYDVVVGNYRLSLRNHTPHEKELRNYNPIYVNTDLAVDDEAPKLLKLYAVYLNKRSSESWLAVIEELVVVENKLNKKEKKMLKLHWDLKIEKLNYSNKTNGVVLGKYVLSITIAAGFKPGYKVGCDPSWKPVGDEEIADLRNSDKITPLEASILAYCSVYGNPTPGAKEELEKALVQAEEEWFAMEQEIKHTAGQLQLHWHAGITDNAKHNPVGKEVIRQPLNDTQWFVLGCMDPTALHPKGISVEPAERLLEVSREHLGVIGLLYLDIVEKDLLNPRGMKHYLMLVKEILEMEKTMDQSKPTYSHNHPSSFSPVDDITVKIELRRTQLKNNWLFQIVDAGTPDYAIWPEASVWCRDSLGNGSDLAILCRPKGDRPIGFLKIGGSPFQQFPSAIITNPLTKAFLKMISCMSTNVLPLEKTSGYVDLLEAVLEQETKMEQKWSTEGTAHQHSLKLNPTPTAYSYLVVFQDLMAPQSTVLGADWVGSFEVKPLYNLAVYRSPSENFALMFTVDGNVRLDAVEAGAKGSGLAAKLSKLAVGRLGHTTSEWAETTELLRACFE